MLHQRSVDGGKHLIHFQSEIPVFKFLRRSVNGALVTTKKYLLSQQSRCGIQNDRRTLTDLSFYLHTYIHNFNFNTVKLNSSAKALNVTRNSDCKEWRHHN